MREAVLVEFYLQILTSMRIKDFVNSLKRLFIFVTN